MKVEVGESLIMSWLRHICKCQMVQTNWSPSSSWTLQNREQLLHIMETASAHFQEKLQVNLFKRTSGLDQTLKQAEIDVLGISLENDTESIYAVDVAFHEQGLRYGNTKLECVQIVVKKCIRMAMCIYGYFNRSDGHIIFASPKINPAEEKLLMECVPEMETVLRACGLNYQIEILCNESFQNRILEPVLQNLEHVADTSELFARSIQLYRLVSKNKKKSI